ncbi:MAG: CTP synthase [Candidatus Pelethousia sp.]|nr:CTP synthase [Candidatus Pelethousia sp.]
METKYIFVTGGVVSGLGKGITAASLGRLLKQCGFKVTIQKFDPYINIDPGTMSPYQHGEVFVTDDGSETDLDLGHYERFIDENLTINSNVTTGKVYWSVISKERRGDYLGATVQVVPHITNEIKDRIFRVSKTLAPDFVITEVGGTVGDIESLPFLEAIRQASLEIGRENCMYIHVTLVPYISASGEQKTKPTQHSVKELLSIGIQPDMIVCRGEHPLSKESCEKLALFCNVPLDCIIQNLDAETLYEVPLMLEKAGILRATLKRLQVPPREPDLEEWENLVINVKSLKDKGTVQIGLVGKYIELHDAYLSVAESLRHGGIANQINVDINWIDAGSVTDETAPRILGELDGILVPGGFGDRGISGKIAAAKFARENNIPYFGICLGMQTAVIEFSRNVAGLPGANSAEFDPDTAYPVVHIMPDKKDLENFGGTLRLGSCPCLLAEGSKVREIYGENVVFERHRHRYEINNQYRKQLVCAGMETVGLSPNGNLVEIIEIPSHPWYIGVQFHPEFKSRPNRPHPLFTSFIKAAVERKEGRGGSAN